MVNRCDEILKGADETYMLMEFAQKSNIGDSNPGFRQFTELFKSFELKM
jgi:hypothetical protein